MEFGLYVHLPYCRSLCPYCAFAKAPLHRAEPERLLRALAREWILARDEARRAWSPARPRTVYVGGGTPTALDAATLRAFFGWLRGAFDLGRVREWTVEANPEGLTDEKLAILREAGVGRLSLGVQSLEPAVLRTLGRIHTAEAALDAIARARAAGFRTLSVDLMVAVPGESAEGVARAVEAMIARSIPHLSVYALQVEASTPLAGKVARGGIVPPGDDVAAERYGAIAGRLAVAGYRHYEVSNFALPGFESRHNEGYWMRRPYLGLGPGAHSFDGERRWGNVESVAAYYARLEAGALPREAVTPVTPEDAAEETIFLGLRRSRGVRLSALGAAARKAAPAWARWASEAGAVRLDPPGRVRPTERGLLTSHEVAAELLARLSPSGASRPDPAAVRPMDRPGSANPTP
ncbi:MAG TPA: radical SAM family heme chaperone HemW [Candidatus Eisenbacteria bacterium]